MKVPQVSALSDSATHYYWRAHAWVISRRTHSVLPADLIYVVLRFVPTWSYFNIYETPEAVTYDCALQYSPWQQPDLDEPRAFGDY